MREGVKLLGLRIEICGGIASGKTTLGGALDGKETLCCFEKFEANPFWSAFYNDPAENAFEAEITFSSSTLPSNQGRVSVSYCGYGVRLFLASRPGVRIYHADS